MNNDKIYNDEWSITLVEDYQPFDNERKIDLGYAKATYFMANAEWFYGKNAIAYNYSVDLSQGKFKNFDFSDEETFESDEFFNALEEVRIEIEDQIQSELIII